MYERPLSASSGQLITLQQAAYVEFLYTIAVAVPTGGSLTASDAGAGRPDAIVRVQPPY